MSGAFDLELQGVWKRYGTEQWGVRDVGFALPHGEFLTLLGPSGSGKTTTLMLVAGFETPTRGRILLQGRDIGAEPPQRRDLGVVFQGYGLFPHMTVQENVEFPLRMRGLDTRERRRRAGAMLERVGLTPFARRRPAALSGGQQQRVALARALVFDPRALLLDEPLGALDRRLREQLQTEINAIRRRLGISVLLVTHDQEEAMAMSDRIAVMRDGRIVQIGTPSEVYLRPATSFVASFLGETNLVPGTVLGTECGWSSVRLADGTVTRARAVPGPAADRTLLSIRPERVLLSAAGVAGVVESVAFLGRHARYAVRALDQVIAVTTTDWPEGGGGAGPGDPVRLAWAEADAQSVADDARVDAGIGDAGRADDGTEV